MTNRPTTRLTNAHNLTLTMSPPRRPLSNIRRPIRAQGFARKLTIGAQGLARPAQTLSRSINPADLLDKGFHNPNVPLGPAAKGAQRRLVRLALMRGRGLLHGVEFDDHSSLVHPGLKRFCRRTSR